MGLLDGLLGQFGGPAAEAIAGKLGIDPAVAQNLMGSLTTSLQNGQSPTDAIAAAAQEHGIDPSVVSSLHDAVSGGGEAGGLGGMLSGLMGGGTNT